MQNLFRWGIDDIDTVSRVFVFVWDVAMTSKNGRTWTLENFTEVEAEYNLMKEKQL